MSPWVFRGLREGVVTTRWPARPDPYETDWRGPAVVADASPAEAAGLAALCPTGAISTGPGLQEPADPKPASPKPASPQSARTVQLDQGRCILCGRCVQQRPDVFAWSHGARVAALTRECLVVPEVITTAPALAAARAELAARTAALRRSVHIRHVDAGSDGTEEQEVAALLNPVYDVHRLGVFFTASPRHADVLMVTGAGAHGMAEPLRRTYEAMPDPKVVIAVGTDAISGGLLSCGPPSDGSLSCGPDLAGSPGLSYATSAGVGQLIAVDVWVPGSPPPPFSILHALLAALGRLAASQEAAR